MKHYIEKVQEPEFSARDKGYTFVSHQQEVGAGYFDDVTTTIQGGLSSVTALSGSTEEEQFDDS
jgi:isocitrate lyase